MRTSQQSVTVPIFGFTFRVGRDGERGLSLFYECDDVNACAMGLINCQLMFARMEGDKTARPSFLYSAPLRRTCISRQGTNHVMLMSSFPVFAKNIEQLLQPCVR